jgi:cell division protein FtsI (penicillin-binding protein 3)
MWKHIRRNAIQIEGEHSSSLDLCRGRLSFLSMFFVIVFMIIGVRAIDLGVVQGDLMRLDPQMRLDLAMAEKDRAGDSAVQHVRRGNIYDRNGVLMATTIKTASLYADPALILEPEKVAAGLVKIFPDIKGDKILAGMKKDGRFVWIKRNISPAQQERVLTLGEPGLSFEYEDRRIYPLGDVATHLLGFTDMDGNGLSGIERGYDAVLRGGKDVKLTLDVRVQHAVKRETAKAIADFEGVAGTGVVMDARTGEVLAGVSLPDFNLNEASEIAKDQLGNQDKIFNRLTLGVYELGSMFKIFSTAAFLETQENGLSKAFDVRTPIKIGRFSISDYKGKNRVLSVPEVFIFSSNIGTANMGRMVGGTALYGLYKDLGLLDAMKFEIKEVGKPLLPAVPWKEVSVLTASYGHGVSTTPLQMCSAVATVVNGGFHASPKLVLDEDGAKAGGSELRILSAETSENMRKMLRLVVTQGTGSKADVAGYAVGGKTGTAEKIVNGRYEHKKLISSFVGAFPMDDPRYVVMVMVDEPKGNKKSHGYATAGWVAAPAVGQIVNAMASVMGLPADTYDPAQDIALDMMPYVQESYSGVKNASAVKPVVEAPIVEAPKLQMEAKRVSY